MFKTTVVAANGESVAVSHNLITCDNPFCRKRNPKFRCAGCQKNFYCSAKCQKSSWKNHKEFCKNTSEVRDIKIPAHKARNTEDEKEDAAAAFNSECGICLSTPLIRPVVLACNHSFCATCLRQWDIQSAVLENNECPTSCPMCRSSSAQEAMLKFHAVRSSSYFLRSKIQTTAEDKRILMEKALLECSEMDSYLNIVSPLQFDDLLTVGGFLVRNQDSDALRREYFNLTNDWLKASIKMEMGDDGVQEAVQLLESMLLRNPESIVGFAKALEFRDTYAKALFKKGDVVKSLVQVMKNKELTVGRMVEQAAMTDNEILLSELWYRVGNWEWSMRSGEQAVHVERYVHGVHKYLALATWASGDVSVAFQVISEACLHEVDESFGTMEENIRLYKALEPLATSPDPSYPFIGEKQAPTYECALCGHPRFEETCLLSGPCYHEYCYTCLKNWWFRRIVEASGQPVRFKGKQASCPVCHERIAELPDDQKQIFLWTDPL